MTTEVLARRPALDILRVKDQERFEAEVTEANAFAQTLGYTRRADLAAREVVPRGTGADARELAQVLSKAGVEPFTPDSVERYKADKAAQANKPWVDEARTRERHRRLSRPLTENELILVLYVGLLGLTLCFLGALWVLFGGMALGPHAIAVGATLLAGVGALGVQFYVAERLRRALERKGVRRFDWVRVPLKGYQDPVPKAALRLAMEIAAVEPRCKFEVDQLVVVEDFEPKPVPRQPDPFLVVVLGDSHFHVAVWDETYRPSFFNEEV